MPLLQKVHSWEEKEKNKLVQNVRFHGIADRGKAVGKDPEGQVVFADKAVPGDVADVWVTKKRKGYLMGTARHFHQLSEERVEPFCQHFGQCGGCKWQYLDYPAQLRYKEQVVNDTLQRIGKVKPEYFLPILGAPQRSVLP